MYTVNVGPTEGGYSAGVTIVRDSTEIFIGDAAGNRRQVSTFTSISNTGGGTDYNLVNANGQHLDSPNTTSSVTYKITAMATNTPIALNRQQNGNQNMDNDNSHISYIIAMEISA